MKNPLPIDPSLIPPLRVISVTLPTAPPLPIEAPPIAEPNLIQPDDRHAKKRRNKRGQISGEIVLGVVNGDDADELEKAFLEDRLGFGTTSGQPGHAAHELWA